MHDAITLLSDPSLGLVRETRPSQVRMARHVEHVLAEGGVAFVEAGVATGKTFAYLLPALLRGKRVVVATARKGLQDQILHKDLPAISAALGEDLKAVLIDDKGSPQILATPLKGKGNYACPVLGEPLARRDGEGAAYAAFLARSPHGDRTEYQGHAPRWWPSASAEECVGKRCQQAASCGFMRLKKETAASRLVVVNHHVLGAEMFLGIGKLVGGPYDVLLVDEAHKLAEGIRAAFTTRATEDSIESILMLLGRTGTAFPKAKRLLDPWRAMFGELPNRHWQEQHLRDVPAFGDESLVDPVLEGLTQSIEELDKTLELYGDDTSEMEAGVQRDLGVMSQVRRRMDGLQRCIQLGQGKVAVQHEEDAETHARRRDRLIANTAVFAGQDERGTFQVSCAPVRLGGIAHGYLSQVRTVLLCSATLAVGGEFRSLVDVTGVAPSVTDILPSPFDYDAQGFVYVPRDLPVVGRQDPAYAETSRARVERACRLVELSSGGAFVLTTANDELDVVATEMKRRFPGRVFVQGHRKNAWDGDPQGVLAAFLATPNAVLIGSKSFWEGVDVPGGQLRLVVMMKLPFPQYNDPMIKARERVSENPFRDVQLADMIIDLRQGAGRLIRTSADRGCVAILDSRVWSKTYGGAVLAALPWTRDVVTSNMSAVEKYLPRYAAHFARKGA